ncbi:MAG: alpha/beta fold hydrolase [Hyphomicrobiales bacterium]|nr:alpha/beta fold hydrolase [Hyphomicrobiales bacterium]MCP5371139.1 alpha/beta fold hydrolase [Hyphomicrobiales bacterium]
MLGRPPAFDPPPLPPRAPWWGGDLQTLRNTLRPPRLPALAGAERLWLDLHDGTGSRLAAALNRPADGGDRPLAVLVHGLTGDEGSANVCLSAAHLLDRGYPVLRLNLRGAGLSAGHSRGAYHAGRSDDLAAALRALPAGLAGRGVVLVAYSLGANMVLKFLAEGHPGPAVRAAAAVSAPIDLKAAQLTIARPRNRLYERYLLTRMKAAAAEGADPGRRRLVAGLRSIYQFDGAIVAADNGFAGADDYYARSAAKQFLARITAPTLIVHALDDPWIPAAAYLDHPWDPDGPLTVLLPATGGHGGFHARGQRVPWHDRCIGAFFDGVVRPAGSADQSAASTMAPRSLSTITGDSK